MYTNVNVGTDFYSIIWDSNSTQLVCNPRAVFQYFQGISEFETIGDQVVESAANALYL